MNNEEKILSILETMQGDISSMKDNIYGRLNKLEAEQEEMAAAIRRIDRSVMIIENEHGKKIGALFDGYQASLDRDKALEPRVTQLERTVDRHGLEILTLKHAK